MAGMTKFCTEMKLFYFKHVYTKLRADRKAQSVSILSDLLSSRVNRQIISTYNIVTKHGGLIV